MSKRGWILTAAGLLAAIVVGIVGAMAVFPSDQPKPVTTPTAVTVRIDATPTPTADPATLPISRSASPPHKPRPAPSPKVVSEPTPASVSTINSW